jgi:uncharacterized membrane protein YhiD involved in acid resistance
MGLRDLLERALLEGYATSELNIGTVFLCIGITALIALYIFFIYRMMNKNSFYSRSFGLALVELAVITSAIILTIQSNIVVSLGMVGALSIVRFRTAIKDPMDLVFLFWSISIGIICGAGFAMIAIVASIALTILLILINISRAEKNTQVLVVNAKEYKEDEILNSVKAHASGWKVRARNVSPEDVNLAIEVKTKEPQELVKAVMALEGVTNVSLLEHDGDVTA